MKKIFIVFIVLSLSNVLRTTAQIKQDKEIVQKRNAVIFSPFNLLDPINPSFQLGYERKLGSQWELQIEGAYIINKELINILVNPNEKDDEYSNKGYKIRSELKYFILTNQLINFYLSGELHYLKNESQVINQFEVSDPSHEYSFELPSDKYETKYQYDDYFTNNKTKYGLNIKVGAKVFLYNMFMEGYLGLGIAYRNNIHSNRENINDESININLLNADLKGEKILLNIPLNLKIGYTF